MRGFPVASCTITAIPHAWPQKLSATPEHFASCCPMSYLELSIEVRASIQVGQAQGMSLGIFPSVSEKSVE